MKTKKLLRVIVYTLAILIIFTSHSIGSSQPLKIIYKGRYLLKDTGYLLNKENPAIGVRKLGEALGYKVTWSKDRKLTMEGGSDLISIDIDKKKIIVNGRTHPEDFRLIIKDGVSYLPLKDFFKVLGEDIAYDARENVFIIGSLKEGLGLKDTFVFHNKEDKYTINFPKEWKNTAEIKLVEDGLKVYDLKTYNRFVEDGEDNPGPGILIRKTKTPNFLEPPEEGDHYILDYDDGFYIEVVFDEDFQYYEDTKDSYNKLKEEGRRSLASFRKDDEYYMIDRDSSREEFLILEELIKKFTPKDKFDINKAYSLENNQGIRLFTLDKDNRYRLRAYFKDGKLIDYTMENKLDELGYGLDEKERLARVNEFIKIARQEDIIMEERPELTPKEYRKNISKTYADRDEEYILVFNIESGYIENYKKVK